MISSSASIGRCLGGVPSFDPQPVFSVPVLDRQFGIAVEAVVMGADLRFDPARLVAQQQVHTQGRLGKLRIDRRGKGVHQLRPLLIADPERRAAVLAVMPVGRAFMAVDRCIPYPERALLPFTLRVSATPMILIAYPPPPALLRQIEQ